MSTKSCPICGLEMNIIKAGNRVFQSDVPGELPKLYRVLYLGCTNKNCTGRYVEERAKETLTELPLEQPIEE